jgi:hypothetical protein
MYLHLTALALILRAEASTTKENREQCVARNRIVLILKITRPDN